MRVSLNISWNAVLLLTASVHTLALPAPGPQTGNALSALDTTVESLKDATIISTLNLVQFIICRVFSLLGVTDDCIAASSSLPDSLLSSLPIDGLSNLASTLQTNPGAVLPALGQSSALSGSSNPDLTALVNGVLGGILPPGSGIAASNAGSPINGPLTIPSNPIASLIGGALGNIPQLSGLPLGQSSSARNTAAATAATTATSSSSSSSIGSVGNTGTSDGTSGVSSGDGTSGVSAVGSTDGNDTTDDSSSASNGGSVSDISLSSSQVATVSLSTETVTVSLTSTLFVTDGITTVTPATVTISDVNAPTQLGRRKRSMQTSAPQLGDHPTRVNSHQGRFHNQRRQDSGSVNLTPISAAAAAIPNPTTTVTVYIGTVTSTVAAETVFAPTPTVVTCNANYFNNYASHDNSNPVGIDTIDLSSLNLPATTEGKLACCAACFGRQDCVYFNLNGNPGSGTSDCQIMVRVASVGQGTGTCPNGLADTLEFSSSSVTGLGDDFELGSQEMGPCNPAPLPTPFSFGSK